MRFKQGKILREQPPKNGFTLVEVVVVLAIIAFAAALVIPRLPAPEGTRLKSSARNLATAIRFLNDQAIITKQRYRLKFDLAESAISIVKLSPSGVELPPDDQLLDHKVLEEGVAIEDVTDPRLGRVSEGEVLVPFGPRGNHDCLTVHLKGGSEQYTVIAYPGGSKVQVLEGYREVTAREEEK